ncbi:MAG: hypothetical protein O7J95_12160 [Planctomycetota bacterium]|nr:hypothetical protein [Planctomycetota bacterium]
MSEGTGEARRTLEWVDGSRGFLLRDGRRTPFSAVVDGPRVWIRLLGTTYCLGVDDASGTPAAGGRTTEDVPETVAPMPGVILSIGVEPGDEVPAGALLLTLEAMKMEHELRAPERLRVREVLVSEGQRVDAGTKLLELETLKERP